MPTAPSSLLQISQIVNVVCMAVILAKFMSSADENTQKVHQVTALAKRQNFNGEAFIPERSVSKYNLHGMSIF